MSGEPSNEEHDRAGQGSRVTGWLGAHRSGIAVAAVVIAVFVMGYLLGGAGRKAAPSEGHEHAGAAEDEKTVFWTCSMHPTVRQPGPGKCPICGMDLIKAGELKLSEAARKLAEVELAPVERRFVTRQIRMIGRVGYDETRLAHITAWVGGRIDKLYVDYTGVTVKKGDHMVWLYSPDILAAQEELLQSVKAVHELARSGSESVRRTALATVTAAREKLRLWGLTLGQIMEIERRGAPEDHMTIYAPVGGVVVHKHVVEGMYVKTGARIYGIADLSQVWVKLDAYESDLAWVRYGQEVEFATEAYPGEGFKGRIAFVDPILDAKTRTVKLRVNVPNPDGRLKPGMFVRATVLAKMAKGGKVVDPDLAGKWIGPMHPEIVKDGPGKCDICGMPLESAEELGYVPAEKAKAPLVIPATAPLITGKRAVVYTEIPGEGGTYSYEGREIVLGPRAGDYYIVREGLMEGDLVVAKGAFKIDSAVQILAKPSMMNPEEEGAAEDREPVKVYEVAGEFREQLDRAYAAYIGVQSALAGDDVSGSKKAARALLEALDGVDMRLLKGPAHHAWMKSLRDLTSAARKIVSAKDIDSAREAFSSLSETLINVAKSLGTSGAMPLHRYHCPMAFGNRGADWLSLKREVRNPYYGARMLGCGDLEETISPGNGRD